VCSSDLPYNFNKGRCRRLFFRKFEKFLTKGRANLKERLKRKQIQVAMQGNVSMLIWLGKQYLEQSDKVVETGDYQIMIKRKQPTPNPSLREGL